MAYTAFDWQVVWNWRDTAASLITAKNVLCFVTEGAFTADELRTAIALDLTDAMFGAEPNNMVADTWTLERLDGTGGPIELPAAKPVGDGNAGQVSPQVCCIVKLLTATGGRSGRGRIFLPCVGEAMQENGILNGTVLTSMQSAWNTFLTTMAGDNVSLAVNSRVTSTTHLVTNAVVESVLATQRRRQSRLRVG